MPSCIEIVYDHPIGINSLLRKLSQFYSLSLHFSTPLAQF